MYLSKRDNGIWYVWHYDENGRKLKRSTKAKTKSEALKFLQRFKIELEDKKHPAPKNVTFSALVDEFLSYSKGVHTEATQKHFRTASNEFARHMGNPKLRSVDVRDLERFLAVKQSEASRWTARRVYIALASMFQKAVQWGYIESNPFRGIKRPTPPERRPLHFSKEELNALLASLRDPQLKILVQTGVFTGMRLGELLSLMWEDVSFEKVEIHVRNKNGFVTKSKKERTLPMHPTLKKILMDWRKKSRSQLVFAREETLRWGVSQMSIRFKSALKRSPLPEQRKRELHFHSLRHTFATMLLQQSVPIYTVSRMLGHSSVRTTEIYAHAIPTDHRSQIEKIRL